MTTATKDKLIIMACIWVLLFLIIAKLCEASEPPGPRDRVDLALWLARACIGEAGWRSAETGECAAIAHVFHKRSYMAPGRDYFTAMREYSAALRVGIKTRPWLRNLRRDGRRPRLLEGQIYWGKHRPLWLKTLELADRFFKGRVLDPTPEALHFGGLMDVKNMDPDQWAIINVNFKNKFWRKKI
jgi:hypothetical protein